MGFSISSSNELLRSLIVVVNNDMFHGDGCQTSCVRCLGHVIQYFLLYIIITLAEPMPGHMLVTLFIQPHPPKFLKVDKTNLHSGYVDAHFATSSALSLIFVVRRSMSPSFSRALFIEKRIIGNRANLTGNIQ